MRAYLATSIGVACTAVLVLPLSLPTGALAASPAAPPSGRNAGPWTGPRAHPDAAAVPGSTESVPLRALGSNRARGAAVEQGVAARDVRPFSLVGVVWDDADDELRGTVQVRTRAVGTHVWSGWLEVETHNQEHGADLGTQERDSGTVRGSTAPLWVGDSDGVELRVRATEEEGETGPVRSLLPRGLRLELVDPGEEPETLPYTPGEDRPEGRPDDRTDTRPGADSGTATGTPASLVTGTSPASGTMTGELAGVAAMSAEDMASSAVNEGLTELGAAEIPALTKAAVAAQADAAAKPYAAPRPRIITRKGWGANESLREKRFGYTSTVKAAFVHHSATGNNYTCKQSPSVLRGIYRYHVKSSGWRDIGYNFAVDKCGNIYEGRAGGVAKPVLGAHTLGFNTNTTGIAVLGSYSGTNPPSAATTAVAKLTAWKLGLHGRNPRAKVTLTSGGSGKYGKGARVSLNTISGHRDGFSTDCPGTRLYGKLGGIRTSAARYQGR